MLQEVRPLTARAVVAELNGPIRTTPVPVPCDIYESDVDLLYLSRKKLVGFPFQLFNNCIVFNNCRDKAPIFWSS